MWESDLKTWTALVAAPTPKVGWLCRWWRGVCTRMLDGQPDKEIPATPPLVFISRQDESAAERSRRRGWCASPLERQLHDMENISE